MLAVVFAIKPKYERRRGLLHLPLKNIVDPHTSQNRARFKDMFAVCAEPAQLFYRRGVFKQTFERTRKQYGELCYDTFEVSAVCSMQVTLSKVGLY